MKTIAIGIAVVIALFFVLALIKRKSGQTAPTTIGDKVTYRFEQKTVMTEVERKLYYALRDAIEDKFLLFAQVNMNGFIDPAKGQDQRAARNTIKTRSVDFLLCSNDGKPLAAIELQDSTHNTTHRQEDDAKKAAALKSAGVPLVEFHARDLPTVTALREQFKQFANSHA